MFIVLMCCHRHLGLASLYAGGLGLTVIGLLICLASLSRVSICSMFSLLPPPSTTYCAYCPLCGQNVLECSERRTYYKVVVLLSRFNFKLNLLSLCLVSSLEFIVFASFPLI